jgi:hypothetical protein
MAISKTDLDDKFKELEYWEKSYRDLLQQKLNLESISKDGTDVRKYIDELEETIQLTTGFIESIKYQYNQIKEHNKLLILTNKSDDIQQQITSLQSLLPHSNPEDQELIKTQIKQLHKEIEIITAEIQKLIK